MATQTELKARKSFGPFKKGQVFTATIHGACVVELIEFAKMELEDGHKMLVPYDSFQIFWDETPKEAK